MNGRGWRFWYVRFWKCDRQSILGHGVKITIYKNKIVLIVGKIFVNVQVPRQISLYQVDGRLAVNFVLLDFWFYINLGENYPQKRLAFDLNKSSWYTCQNNEKHLAMLYKSVENLRMIYQIGNETMERILIGQNYGERKK